MKTILILRGLQGSGKTTFAKEWVSKDPESRVRFNRDDIRNMLGKYWVPKREPLITDVYMDFLKRAMTSQYDIVIDNMNLNEKYIEEIKSKVKDFNEWVRNIKDFEPYEVEIKDFFNVPLTTCIERDALRDNPIGENVIRATYDKYKDIIMKEFTLTVYTLVKVWKREDVVVKANSLEEAISKIINYDDNVEYMESEYLYETEVGLGPEDNDNTATLEIMDGDKIIYSNESNR